MSDHDPRDPGGSTPDDDPTAARLRAALTAEAAMVQPDDSLSSIRERTASERPWWQKPAVLATAAAVVLGLAAGGAVAVLGGDDDPTVAVPGGQGSSTGAPATTSGAETSPSPSEGTGTPTPSAIEGAVFVYYVMDADAAGPRLYREERPNPGMDPVTAALSTMFAEPPLDPDYDSPWPRDTSVLDYSVDGDTAQVDLSGFVSAGAEGEDIAVQQLVYTVTANDTSVKQVRVLVDGKTPASGHQDWSEPVSRAPRLDVQGLIWLLGPTEGATVSSPVEITGYGTAFEATVNWEVRRQGSDEVVAEGFTNAGANGEFAEFSDSVELDPGTYEVRAYEASAEDGRPLNTDTKVFTVE